MNRLTLAAAALAFAAPLVAQRPAADLIVTNARVTEGSREYARSRRCTLIGLEEFPDFVLGKMPL